MLGFPHLRRFLLIRGQDLEPFVLLQSIDEPLICFPLIPPSSVDPNYRFELTSEQQSRLQIRKGEDSVVFSVVTLNGDVAAASANLFAPIVINVSTLRGAQFVPTESVYPVSAPLLRQ